jgi:integrase
VARTTATSSSVGAGSDAKRSPCLFALANHQGRDWKASLPGEEFLRPALPARGAAALEQVHGLSASPDPLEALKNRYRLEGRRSLERLEDAVEHLRRMFRGVPAVQVKGADVLRYANLRLEEKAKPATINRELAALRAAYRLGLDNDTIVAMPRIRLLPENNARQGFAEVKQVASICRRLPPDLADAVQFMFVTGWRSRSEVLPLTWAQVDFAGGFVRLEPGTTKNNEGRAFPLIPELRVLLERRQAITRRCERAQARIIAHVFHRYGKPIKSLRRAWMTACKDAGRPRLLLNMT